MRVLIAGGTGFVGKHLCEALRERGDEVFVLTRSEASAKRALGAWVNVVPWNPSGMNTDIQLPEGTDAVVNLAGESIAEGRWTEELKTRIHLSRVLTTQTIVRAISAASPRPATLVNASAIGYYGPRDDETLTEQSAPGEGFLTNVVKDWEHSARDAEPLGVRVVLLRIGVVLGRGGALAKMTTPFKLFAGGPIGSGQQWMSWIHVDDVVGMTLWSLDNIEVRGPINTVAPEPLRNVDFSRELGAALGRPSWLPAPAFALKLILGEMAETLLLHGQRVIPEQAQKLGYRFKYSTAREALREAVGSGG